MNALVNVLREAAVPLFGAPSDYDLLLERMEGITLVLLGEASHGTHEFYKERAQITKRLIQEKGFNAVAIEGDWPDASRVHRYVRGSDQDREAVDALAGFKRFPSWMWRNADVLDFVGWLRNHNEAVSGIAEKVGFYGLDLYSLHASMQAVLAYLSKVDPASVSRARHRYACFDHFGKETQNYGLGVKLGLGLSCEQEVVNELAELRLREAQYMQRDGRIAADDFFCAEQNALVIKNAEAYYRAMFDSAVSSWNLRDQHMFETLRALRGHLGGAGFSPKIVVWAHNSHLGDARATSMGDRGELNLGQLCRQAWFATVANVGFTTYSGTVTAATEWDAPAERKQVRPALRNSCEDIFHQVGHGRFFLDLKRENEAAFNLAGRRLERAIGVVYRPETERQSHYFDCSLSKQFDYVLHFDHTRAVEPLERTSVWEAAEIPETFPSGI